MVTARPENGREIMRFSGGIPIKKARVFLFLALFLAALFSLAACGSGDAKTGGLSGVRVSIAIPGQKNGLVAGLEGISDVNSVTVDVLEGAHYLVLGHTLAYSNGAWSGAINDLPMDTNLTFVAHAYDNNGKQIFSGNFSSSGITSANNGGNAIEIVLSPVTVTAGFPVISGITLPASVSPSGQMSISLSVSGSSDEILTYQLNDTSGGAFSNGTSGSIALNGAGSGGIKLTYNAPSADGAYTDKITVTNSQGNSVSQGFVITVSGSAASGHQFIALAGDFSTSYILNSSDGANWSLVYNGASSSSHITGVAYGDGKWVAVGSAGSNSAILASTGGRTWTQTYSASNSSTPIEGIAFDNGTGTFMAMDQYAAHYYVSADGSNWTAYTGNTHGGSVYGIAGAVFGKGVYVAAEVMSGYIDSYTLSDQTWHSFYDPQLNPYSIAYLNGLFFVSSYNGFYYSSDGVNWTLVPESNSPAGIAYGNGLYILAQGVQSPPSCNISYSTDGVNWTASGYSGTSFDCTGAYFANGVFFVTPGAAGSGPVLRSTDGKTWNRAASSNTSFYYSNIIYGNNTYVAAGNSVINYNSGIFDSTDGSTWTGILNTTSYSGMGSLSEIVYH